MFSVAIIAKNAADVIGSCIESVSPLTTDIVVVVDSSSSDTTSAIGNLMISPHRKIMRYRSRNSNGYYPWTQMKQPPKN